LSKTNLDSDQLYLKLHLARCLLFLPLAFHWSSFKGFIPRWVVAILGSGEALVGAYSSWQANSFSEDEEEIDL